MTQPARNRHEHIGAVIEANALGVALIAAVLAIAFAAGWFLRGAM